MNRRVATFAAASLALVAAGCGGTDEAAAPVATTSVTMVKSYRFEPKAIQIDAGESVTWTNDDNFTHTVHVDGMPDHKVERGGRVAIKFDRPGRYHYDCTLHRHDMDGEVIVK